MTGAPLGPAHVPPGAVLGFDFGTRKVGVALGNTLTRTAHALLTIHEEARDRRFAAIASLLQQWQPTALVVGLPVHADGTPHDTTARASRFARQLHGRFHLPVATVDERYTTQLAGHDDGPSGRSARADRDARAAQIILQAWLDQDAPAVDA